MFQRYNLYKSYREKILTNYIENKIKRDDLIRLKEYIILRDKIIEKFAFDFYFPIKRDDDDNKIDEIEQIFSNNNDVQV